MKSIKKQSKKSIKKQSKKSIKKQSKKSIKKIKGGAIVVKFDASSFLKNSQISDENYDVVNNIGFYTESAKILVDNGFATCIGICATVDNKNYMSHLYPHEYTDIDNPTLNSWINLINAKNITKLIIFGLDNSDLITFSDKLQKLLQPLDINLYVLINYDPFNNTIFIGIDKNELIIIKNKLHFHIKYQGKVDFAKFIKPDLLSKLKTANKSYYYYNCSYLRNNFKMLVIGDPKFEIKEDEHGKGYEKQIIDILLNNYNFIFVYNINDNEQEFWNTFKKGDTVVYQKICNSLKIQNSNSYLITK
jgi:hypothetical protein